MKFAVLFAVGILFCATLNSQEKPKISFRTTDGVEYTEATIVQIFPHEIKVVYPSGIARIPMEKLPESLQKHVGYDPEEAAVAKKEMEDYQAAVRAENARRAAANAAAHQKKAGEEAFVREKLNQWAAENAASKIISEQILLEIIGHDPSFVEGRSYLVEGKVAGIRAAGSTLSKAEPGKVVIGLAGRTVCGADFSGYADGKSKKIVVTDRAVVLAKARKYSNGRFSNFTPEKTLLEVGNVVTLAATVTRGKVVGQRLATSQDIAAAQVNDARQQGATPNQMINIQRIQNRIQLLEEQLASGVSGKADVTGTGGYIGTVTVKYSDAEKAAMRREIELLELQLRTATGR